MFIEVYAIQWTESAEKSKTKENRRLICINDIRVKYSNIFKDRAEIVFPTGDTLHVVGSYDEIVERISRVTKVIHLT